MLSLKRRYGSGYKLSVALQELLEAGGPGLGPGRKLLEAGEPGAGRSSGETGTGGHAQDGEEGGGRGGGGEERGRGRAERAVERLRGLVEGCLGTAGSKAGGSGEGRQGGVGAGGVAVELGRSHVHFQVRAGRHASVLQQAGVLRWGWNGASAVRVMKCVLQRPSSALPPQVPRSCEAALPLLFDKLEVGDGGGQKRMQGRLLTVISMHSEYAWELGRRTVGVVK